MRYHDYDDTDNDVRVSCRCCGVELFACDEDYVLTDARVLCMQCGALPAPRVDDLDDEWGLPYDVRAFARQRR